jgi:hypothetical protein
LTDRRRLEYGVWRRCWIVTIVVVVVCGGGEVWNSFPPRRGFEFNFSKVSRQDEQAKLIRQKFGMTMTN